MSDVTVILHTAPPPGAKGSDGALTKIDGRECVLRAMEMFTNRPGVAQTMLVVDAADAEAFKSKIGSHLMFMGIKLVQAGSTWIEQLRAARERVGEAAQILVHDAARPTVPYTDLDAMFALVDQFPVVSLATPMVGPIVRAKVIPGPGTLEPQQDLAALLSPSLYQRAAFDALCESGEPSQSLQLIEGSPLNVRVGDVSEGMVKSMIALLPKPKTRAALNPFEEAQW